MSEEKETYDIEITPGTDEVEDPVPVTIFGDGLVIFDPIEFAAAYNCLAARIEGGVLTVLDRETSRWRSVEPAPVKPVSVR
jgi:hypothetical protein